MTRQEKNEQFLLSSFLYGGNATYIEDLYSRFKTDPASIDPTWASYFGRLEDTSADVAANADGPSWGRSDWPQTANGDLVSALDGNWGEIVVKTGAALTKKAAETGAPAPTPVDVMQSTRDSIRAIMMIRAYRMRGHLHADLDPLKLKQDESAPELDPATYGFTEADYDRKIFIDHVLGLEFATLHEMLAILKRTYCSTVGVEYMHISDPEAKQWVQERMEGPDKEIKFTENGKKAILNKLIEAEGFEKFLDVKYTGTKRFGLDGGESLIPALEQIIKRGGALGVKDIVLGMAHRGRLNVLTQVMMKPHRALFHEFKGGAYYSEDVEGSGDVKYHLGASSDREFDGNQVHLSLTANPSHLEIVDPVVLGKARAKQDQRAMVDGRFLAETRQTDRSVVMPLLLHGDAAFAGQGVIAECLGLSGLKGHRTGGSIHFVINNQIGFTTSPMNSRSSPYPTDVAKMIEAPVFHVNGDDPEAVVYVSKVATEFRQRFGRPVVIDMFCYRRFGHNEGDEPSFTQPLMYSRIRSHKTTLELYSERLVGEGLVTTDEIEKLKADWRAHLEGRIRVRPGFPAEQDRLARRPVEGHAQGGCRRSASRRHGRAARYAGLRGHQARDGAVELPRPQDDQALPRQSPRGDRERRGDRLVDRRGAGVRHAAQGRPSGPAQRPGFRAGHVHATPLGALRSGDRRDVHATQQSGGRSGTLRGHQLDAFRRGRARLRIRLLAGRAQYAHAVGSAVRRLRQRRAGGGRPVHLIG